MATKASRSYSDSTTTTFEKMGDSIPHSVVNLSRSSPYTKTVSKNTKGRGKSPTGAKANRGATVIHEAHGPQFHISATLYHQNAPEASAVQRNTRLLPTAVGNRDFWAQRRDFGQKTS